MRSEFLIRVLTDSSNPYADGYVPGCGMSTRPAFYSGRGATTTDLSSAKLERIYQAIDRNVGPQAAHAFARMVQDIPVLSATDFLLALQRLEANEWRWTQDMLGTERGLYAESMRDAACTVAQVVGNKDQPPMDWTIEIRRTFLLKHDLKEPLAGRVSKGLDIYGCCSSQGR